jgi:hypothetical protein
MERVETLLKKLQDQFAQHALPAQLLLTVQMLQSELIHVQQNNSSADRPDPVAVTVFNLIAETPPAPEKIQIENSAAPAEKTIEVLQVDEAEIEAELEEIKRNAEAMKQISVQNKPHISFESDEDIPTLTHQKQPVEPVRMAREINEAVNPAHTSLNDKLKQSRIDLGDTLVEQPIRDLRKAIGVNDRFLFINDLFRGDEAVYERSIKTINSFSIFAEAEYWIQRELKVKNGWKDSDNLVQQFYQLVRRRFS